MRVSGPWFTLVFSVAYAVVFLLDLPLFLYYPLEREFRVAPLGGDAGPAMHWYGLLATSALVALVVAAVARTEWLSPRLRGWLWLAPVACMGVVAWALRPFFA